METFSTEVVKNAAKKVVDNWDNSGLAFFFAVLSAIAFCFAAIINGDWLSSPLQLFGVAVLYMMMLKIPVYYIAEEKGISDKSSASFGLTVCFAILTTLLTVKTATRTHYYYFGLAITVMFALLMVWRMNMSDSRVNVRKTFTVSTVVLLAQCVLAAVLLSDDDSEHRLKLGTQLLATTLLLLICIYRLVAFLRSRRSIEKELGVQLSTADT